jgi:hypothetical protein
MDENDLRVAMSAMGRRGGKAKTLKLRGLATLTPERRAEISSLGV